MVNLANLPNASTLSGSETLPMQQGSGAVKVTANQLLSRAAGQTLPFDIGGQRIVTVTEAGVGIGTATPSRALVVNGDLAFSYNATVANNGIRRNGLGTEYFNTLTGIASELIHNFTGSAGQTFLAITGNGTLLFNKGASSSSTAGVEFRKPGQIVAIEESTNALHLARLNTDGAVATFARGTAVVGSIAVSAAATSYNTASDYRLKGGFTEIDAESAIDRVKQLRPGRFAWKSTGEEVDGFLAHEAQEVVPEAVTGQKDAVEEIGDATGYREHDPETGVPILTSKETLTGITQAECPEGYTWTKTGERPVYQGIDQSKLVPLLAAGLKAALRLIRAQETTIDALEARIAALEAATQ